MTAISFFVLENLFGMKRPHFENPHCTSCAYKNDSVLKHCTLEEFDTLIEQKTYNIYKKGQIIFYEGNQPQGLYCIHEGKVKVHKLGEEGKEQIVRFAKIGNLLGYRALLSGETYNASATALEDTKMCYIPRNTFLKLVQQNSSLSIETIRLLTNDLKKAEQKIMNMAQKPVRERMAEALLILKECYGLETDNATIASVLTRRDIASIAGTTTETSIRVLSDLNKEGVVELNGKKIRILNLNKLIKIANILD
jgi:CRP/FNR family transcriptional regulator, polysaccharide utilization system transcription regulator